MNHDEAAVNRLIAAFEAAAANDRVFDVHEAAQRLLTKVVGQIASILLVSGQADGADQLIEATVRRLEAELELRLADAETEMEGRD